MKKYLAFILVLVCVSGLLGCANTAQSREGEERICLSVDTDEKSGTFFIAEAETLAVVSGMTGERIDITNTDDVKYIADNINTLAYERGEKVDSDGWSYELQWFDGDGVCIERFTILGDGSTIVCDGYCYAEISGNGEIDVAFLRRQFAQ